MSWAGHDPNSENDAASTGDDDQRRQPRRDGIGPAGVVAGATITYTLGLSNAGPDPGIGATLSDTLPDHTRFVSFAQTGGAAFVLSTPAPGAAGTVTASRALHGQRRIRAVHARRRRRPRHARRHGDRAHRHRVGTGRRPRHDRQQRHGLHAGGTRGAGRHRRRSRQRPAGHRGRHRRRPARPGDDGHLRRCGRLVHASTPAGTSPRWRPPASTGRSTCGSATRPGSAPRRASARFTYTAPPVAAAAGRRRAGGRAAG